ncbi:non-heme iron protein [Helicobacter sp. MIT 05-5293]|uniref:bacteriohemerythrin n=1 Tax=Helicobacter sp. MIT 05-5293 TaxID=1548149 RepID=UPI0010FEBA66|nr:bacteriohemerythrin [Helicobacter sp. MIT 05-5293]TLD81956.1 non-heme iron protein [Helicobacter sp. MIT 05-5293]
MLPLWNDEFSVRHEIIDQQHQRLFELAHKAYKIANSHTTRNEVKGIITEFFDYMKTHFKDEEQYMQAIGYPKLEEHKRIHRALIADMASMVKNIHSANELKDKIMILAKDWLLVHILQEDMQIEKYRKESQAKNPTKEATKTFIYTCECPGKEHKLTESMHIFVKNSTQSIRCKECQQAIVFKEMLE